MREIFAQAATFNNLLSLYDIVVVVIPSPSIGAYTIMKYVGILILNGAHPSSEF